MTSTEMNDFERARLLIPGFLKKTLADDDKAWMTQFIETLPQQSESLSRQFHDEMAWVELTQAQLNAATPVFDSQAGWKTMENQLDLQNTKTTPKPRKNLGDLLKALVSAKFGMLIAFWRRPMVGVLASGMIVAQMGLLAALVRYTGQSGTQENVVVPASGASSVAGAVLFSVVFKDAASSKEIRELLAANQAQIVGGPGAIGVWVISVPKEKLLDAAKAFVKSPIVESAEPQ
jgi:hypothetical protein